MANTKHSAAREIIIDRLLHKRCGYSLYEMLEIVNQSLEVNGYRPVSLNTIRNDIETFQYLYKQAIHVERRGYQNYSLSLDECFTSIKEYAEEDVEEELDGLARDIRLYQIESPIVVNSSDYGVPQNRERVLFIGCRKDQTLIENIPATIDAKDKVTVYEAISDLNFIDNGEEKTEYEAVEANDQYLGLLRHRKADSTIGRGRCNTLYSDWCRNGRLGFRFSMEKPPFYVT